MITYFGIAESNGQLQTSPGKDAFGRPVFPRAQGRNFLIVVEAGEGTNGFDPGIVTFNSDESDPSLRPDLQIRADRTLGNGSLAVCDDTPQNLGGVPAISSFDPASQLVANALNDFACRFIVHSRSDEACTSIGGIDRFKSGSTQVQFCFEPAVGSEVQFPLDDTVLTVMVRDLQGGFGEPAQIVVRVLP